eukprot:scaffold2895_cov284-Pinguiococcus_pyrenoidosus.AAC.2
MLLRWRVLRLVAITGPAVPSWKGQRRVSYPDHSRNSGESSPLSSGLPAPQTNGTESAAAS